MPHPLWNLPRTGRSVAVVGGSAGPPPDDFLLVQVDCRWSRRPYGPLIVAAEKITRSLAPTAPQPGPRGGRAGALRHRLLERLPRSPVETLAAIFNDLADRARRPAALHLLHVEAAEAATIECLAGLLGQAGRLRLPLVLEVGPAADDGPVGPVLAALRAVGGPEAIVAVDGPVVEAAGRRRPYPELGSDVLRVLQAGAFLGPTFDVAGVCGLLDLDPAEVLERLQRAYDAGVPIVDDGEQFALPEPAAESLRDSLLPALARAWSARRGAAPVAIAAGQPVPETIDVAAAEARQSLAGILEGGDPARPAGPPVLAEVDRLLAAARQVARLGDLGRALALVERSLAMLDGQAPSGPVARRRIEALGEVGRLRWAAAGWGDSNLEDALGPLDSALAALEPGGEPAIEAGLRSLIAGVCHDLGDPAHLERALEESATACRLLSAAGQPIEAARQLNDQAAILVRLGDPVRAAHHLDEARRIFGALPADDPVGRLERAETDHLSARLGLHVAPRPGKEEAALGRLLERARSAEAAYRELGDHRELARVHETQGRLLLTAGRLDEAAAHLNAALRTQGSIGDVVGLARSAGGLAEVLAAAGRPDDGLELLGQSIDLNVRTGSPLGLAYCRRTLEALAGAARPASEALAERLAAAEERIGLVRLP